MAETRGWTDEIRDFALDRASKGDSGTSIANQIFKTFKVYKTRNAVIGLVFRAGKHLHSVNRTTQSTKLGRLRAAAFRARGGNRRPRPATVSPQFVAEPLPPPSETDIPRKPLLALDDNDCRFPVGDGQPQMFCVDEKVPGQSYCMSHLKHCVGSSRELYQRPAIGRILLNANGAMRSELENA